MLDHCILIISLLSVYYHVGGLSTTNILRLTNGYELSVNSSICKCGNCGKKITPLLQLPIISYVLCKGKCLNCGIRLSIFQLILEILVFVGMSMISLMYKMSPLGIVFSYIYYELIRVIVLIIKKYRKTHFIKQYLIAVLSMIPFILCSLFISLLFQIV